MSRMTRDAAEVLDFLKKNPDPNGYGVTIIEMRKHLDIKVPNIRKALDTLDVIKHRAHDADPWPKFRLRKPGEDSNPRTRTKYPRKKNIYNRAYKRWLDGEEVPVSVGTRGD